MATVPAQSLRVSEIKDPTVLFERYGTDEIRAIERKVRGEIEHKKEELRQMVGERYRDLIDAADTIGEMRQCSESVVQSIQDMYRYCHKLKQAKHAPQSSGKAEVKLSFWSTGTKQTACRKFHVFCIYSGFFYSASSEIFPYVWVLLSFSSQSIWVTVRYKSNKSNICYKCCIKR